MFIIGRQIVYEVVDGRPDRNRHTLISEILFVRRAIRRGRARFRELQSNWPGNENAVWSADHPIFLDYLHGVVSGYLYCPLADKSVDELERILQSLLAIDPENPPPPRAVCLEKANAKVPDE